MQPEGGQEKVVFHTPVTWAQRNDSVFVNISVEDCKKEDLQVTDTSLHFKGKGGPEHHVYECNLEFYDEVDGSSYRVVPSDRQIQLVIPKKKTGPYWPRLQKGNQKVHWIKVDFSKWKDEDDSDQEDNFNFDLNNMMGGMGAGGMDYDKPDLDDFEDSDNEDLPELEDDSAPNADDIKASAESESPTAKAEETSPDK